VPVDPAPVIDPAAVPAVDPNPAAPEAAPAPDAPVDLAAPAEAPKEFAPPEPEPSLFQTAGEPEPGAKPEAGAEGEKPPQQPDVPRYEDFKLPEGLQAAPEALKAYTDVLGKHGLTHEIQKYAQATLANQWEQFGQTKAQWADDARKDPEIGGARFDNTMHLVALARDRILPKTGPVREAFDKFLNDTGVGNHPEFLRAWSRVGLAFSEPAAPQPAQKPPADIGLRPNGRAYENVYNHPSSQAGLR
jgi:hypothetical protein